MPDEKQPDSSGQTHQIKGHSVEIIKNDDGEQLWIDGTAHKFFKNEAGYFIGYIPPEKSLIQAVQSYLDDFPEKK